MNEKNLENFPKKPPSKDQRKTGKETKTEKYNQEEN